MAGTISGSVTANGIKFEYRESKTSDVGGGPRGIEVKAEGSPKGFVKFYPITPNPHDNPKYNKNQEGFYKAVATSLVQNIKAEKEETKFTPLKSGERPPSIKGPDWTKLNKTQQEAKIKEHNTAEKKKIDEKNNKAYFESLHTDIAAKHGSTCTWEGVSYKLP